MCLLIGAVGCLARFARVEKVRPRLTDEDFHDRTNERERSEPYIVMTVPIPDLLVSGPFVIRYILVTISGMADVFRDPHLKSNMWIH